MALKQKTGGRVKGISTNKVSRELKEIINDLLKKEFESITETLQQLEPDKKLDILIRLLPYAIPKIQSMQQIEVNQKIDNPIIQLTPEQIEKAINNL